MLDTQSWWLQWADDFSGPAGSPPDPGRWNRNTGGHGWGNAELQGYTAARDNAFLDGRGRLVIRAVRSATLALSGYGISPFVTMMRSSTRPSVTAVRRVTDPCLSLGALPCPPLRGP